jgi:spore coat polysaccharide biosynthesis protein SpsF (cytidylyltransferase family)
VDAPAELLRPRYFLSVDYPEDLALLEGIYERFNRRNDMELREVVSYLDANPGLTAINAGLHQGFDQ